MRVLYSVLCEEALMREDGRADLRGVFHHLFAPGFPAQQDRMTLVVVIDWEPEEAGRVEFRIDLVDPTSSPALTINGHTDVSRPGKYQPPQQTRIVMGLEKVVFPQGGTYEFELHVRGERITLLPLHLVENPEAR